MLLETSYSEQNLKLIPGCFHSMKDSVNSINLDMPRGYHFRLLRVAE